MIHTELEDRLRSAYAARTRLVTADHLDHSAPDFDAPVVRGGGRRRSVLAPLLAAAAVVLLAIAATVVARVSSDHSAPADQPLRFTPPRIKTWDGIAPGWTVALWSQTPESHNEIVYLISPSGARQKVADLDTGSARFVALDGLSADQRRVAITAGPGTGNGLTVITVDLRDHTQTTFTLHRSSSYRGFASADGTTHRVALGNGARLEIVDSSGRVLSTRRTTAGERGVADGSAVAATVDGQPVWLSARARIVTITRDSGEVLAQLRSPAKGCVPVRPWDADALLVRCGSGMWTVPLDGGAPAQLAKPDPGVVLRDGTRAFIYELFDMYRVGGGLYGVEIPTCGGDDAIARIGADLVPHRVGPIGKLPVGGSITGVSDDAFRYLSVYGCSGAGARALYEYAPAQHKVTPLLGGSLAGGGTVRGAITVDSATQWDNRFGAP